VAHRDELTSCIEAVLIRQPTEHWLRKLKAAGVPAAEVRGLADVLGWSQVTALGSLQAPAPGHHVVGPPFRLDRTVLAYPGPAPALGRDTRPVLAELGYPPDEIARLEDAGVVVAT
jgi:crotonobetainyl-CoA:carnitine CoA-transferase CaiB-like acyl-CoA transferase